jgi:glycine/D-amino acid oxidase-like deaminating enzyme
MSSKETRQARYQPFGFLDSCPNAYVAVTHSGVTLAALLGQLVATEVLDRVRVERLDPYGRDVSAEPVRRRALQSAK